MAVSIRLSRGGAKKRPYYRIVVADGRSSRDGKYLEQIGTYNPLLAKDDEKRVTLNEDRARHWLSVGAQPSDRVARFLDAAGVRERAARNNPKKGEPGAAAKERLELKAQKEAEAAEAAEAAKAAEAEAAAAAAEAPAAEATSDDAAEAPAEASSSDNAAEGTETPATGDEAAAAPSSDEPAEGSEQVVAEAEAAAEAAPAEEAPAEAAPAEDKAEG